MPEKLVPAFKWQKGRIIVVIEQSEGDTSARKLYPIYW